MHRLKRPKILDPRHAPVVSLFPSRNNLNYLVRMVGSPFTNAFTKRAHLLAQIKHECTESMALSAGMNPGPEDAI